MDHRDVAGHKRGVLQNLNTRSMTAEFEDFDETVHQVRICFEVCGTCDGKGTHVNPSIDAHGLTAEDFAEDPDFADEYFRGFYDQPCNECHGERVVPTVDPEANPADVCQLFREAEEAAWASARERTREYEFGY